MATCVVLGKSETIVILRSVVRDEGSQPLGLVSTSRIGLCLRDLYSAIEPLLAPEYDSPISCLTSLEDSPCQSK